MNVTQPNWNPIWTSNMVLDFFIKLMFSQMNKTKHKVNWNHNITQTRLSFVLSFGCFCKIKYIRWNIVCFYTLKNKNKLQKANKNTTINWSWNVEQDFFWHFFHISHLKIQYQEYCSNSLQPKLNVTNCTKHMC